MPRALSNGIELEYDTFGDPSDPALLLVMGFTAQMTAWDEESVQAPGRRGPVRHPVRQPGLRALHQARRRPGRPGAVPGGADGPRSPAGRRHRALQAHRHGRRRHRSARPPGHRAGPHRGRLDGRHDRPDDGHRAPRARGDDDLDHVDHRRSVRRPGRPGGRRCAAHPAAHRPRGGRRPLGAGREGVREQALLRRRSGGGEGRRGLRPLVLPRGRPPPARRRSSPPATAASASPSSPPPPS